MTVVEVVLLCLGGMPLFDSLIHSFGSAGTGGFSSRALSVGAYQSPYAEIVIGIFMLLFGINFNLYYFLLLRHWKEALFSEELLTYLGIVAASTLAITGNIRHLCGSLGEALRLAFFQVSSMHHHHRLRHNRFQPLALLFPHHPCAADVHRACAGSTAGGLKVSRVVILCKSAVQEVRHMLHPHAVTAVRFEGKPCVTARCAPPAPT